MNIGDGLRWGYLGFMLGWACTLLVQWWVRKVAADFRGELEEKLLDAARDRKSGE